MRGRLTTSVLITLAFVMTVLVVAGWGAFGAMSRMMALPTAPSAETGALPEPAPQAVSAVERPVALVLASSAGTEITDLVAPAAVLAASGAFEVRIVAPSRIAVPLTGGIDLLPDIALNDPLLRQRRVALVVVPLFLDASNPDILAGLRALAGAGAHVLSVCEGARTVAAAGLFEGLPATTHFFALDSLAKKHPGVAWRSGARFITGERVSSSAGVTAALDATLAVVAQLAGTAAARRAVNSLGLIEHGQGVESPELDFAEIGVLLVGAGFGGRPAQVGVVVPAGVDELQLAALLDLHPRSFRAVPRTLSLAPGWLVSRHGLRLRARGVLGEAAGLDELVVAAGDDDGAALAAARGLANRDGLPLEDLAQVVPGRSFDHVLDGIARRVDVTTARVAAEMVEWPWRAAREVPPGIERPRAWPWSATLRALGWGSAGALLAAWVLTRGRHLAGVRRHG